MYLPEGFPCTYYVHVQLCSVALPNTHYLTVGAGANILSFQNEEVQQLRKSHFMKEDEDQNEDEC
jgi:hypothetical protein